MTRTRPNPMLAMTLGIWACLSSPASGAGEPFDLQGAIRAAGPGEVIHVPAGIYAGTILIDRPLSLIAEAGAVIDGGGEGDVVDVTAPDVTIRGFVIRNTGASLDLENAGISVVASRVTIEGNTLRDVLFGIYLKGSNGSVIRGNVIGGKDLDVPRRGDGIRMWECRDGVVEDNTITSSRDTVMWFSDGTQIRRNHISYGRYGLHFMYSDSNVLEDNVLENNSVGAFLMYSQNLTLRRNTFARNRGPSGFGIGLKDMDGLIAENNLFVGNRVGLQIDNSPSRVDVQHVYRGNVFAYNDVGVAFTPSVERNNFTGNTFLDNLEQVGLLGGGDFKGNDFTYEGRGNYWSDYRGFDLDGDGVGDVPYHAQSLFENLMDREPRLRLFLFSPAQQAVEMAARAMPIVRPKPKVTDDAPLMSPIAASVTPREPASTAGLWSASLILLGGGASIVTGGVTRGSWRRRRVANRVRGGVRAKSRTSRDRKGAVPIGRPTGGDRAGGRR